MSFEVLGTRMHREPSGHLRRELLCRCKCGDTRWRNAGNIHSGKSTQCKSCAVKTHGLSKTREYKAWYAMLHRCTNPNNRWYKRYGGRGINVCGEWLQFEQFLADMGPCPPGLTLERKDNDAGYSKDNCVWASRLQQMSNSSFNVKLTAFGKTQHVAEWCREYRLRHDTFAHRLKRGWSVEKALTTPVRSPHGKAV